MLCCFLLYGLFTALAACPPGCFSCTADGICLGPDGRTPSNTGSYERFCRDGFSGSTCGNNCPANCAQSYCSLDGYCMAAPTRTPGSDYNSAGSYDRAKFCKDGFFGSTCGNKCPVNCAMRFCSADGYCMATLTRTAKSDYNSAGSYDRASFCKDGFSGSTCRNSCPAHCAQPYCSADGYCMASPMRLAGSDYNSAASYDRASFCKDGFYGSTCGNTCPTNCAKAWCSADGYCLACATRTPLGDYSSAGSYDRAHFCKDGFYGSTCGNACSANCAQAWCSADGYCLAQADREPKGDYSSTTCDDPASFCKAGWSGSACGNACPSACSSACNACGGCTIAPSPTPAVPNNPYPHLACAQSTPVPAACTNIGQCSWYSSCLQQSTPAACPDIAAVMQAKCSEYETLEPSLSPVGQQWSKNVRSCLQSQLSKLWEGGTSFGTVQCDFIRSEFFDNHLPCYLDGPVSYCDITTKDGIKVILHAASILVSSHFWSALSSGAQLEARCHLSYHQVNVEPRQQQQQQNSLNQADVESDLRQFFQSSFGPQGWSADIVSINASAFALGFHPATPAAPPATALEPSAVTSALIAWANTSTIGANYQVSINDGPPLDVTGRPGLAAPPLAANAGSRGAAAVPQIIMLFLLAYLPLQSLC